MNTRNIPPNPFEEMDKADKQEDNYQTATFATESKATDRTNILNR